jgi:hypothetical protein
MSDKIHVPAALLPVQGSSCVFDRRLGEPRNESTRRGEEIILVDSEGFDGVRVTVGITDFLDFLHRPAL